jgi:chromosome segregation ATPase
MTFSEVLDAVARVSLIFGIPGIITYLVKERRKNNANARVAEADADKAEADADFDEADLPNKVRSSSIVTLESEMAAMQRTFDRDRKVTRETIQWLEEQLRNERRASARKDDRIRELEEKVQELQRRVAGLSQDLARVSEELASLHSDQP